MGLEDQFDLDDLGIFYRVTIGSLQTVVSDEIGEKSNVSGFSVIILTLKQLDEGFGEEVLHLIQFTESITGLKFIQIDNVSGSKCESIDGVVKFLRDHRYTIHIIFN